MRRIRALLPDGADRLQQLLAVVAELEECLVVVVHDPDVLLRIVGADVDRVRTPEHLVPLRPLLDDVALRVEDEEEMLPARIDPEASFVGLRRIIRIRTGRAASGRARVLPLRGVTERDLANGERQTWADLRNRCDRRTLQLRQLAHLNHEDAVGVFSEDRFGGAPRPLIVSRELRQRLRPIARDIVWSREIPSAFFSGHRGEPGAGLCLAVNWQRGRRDEQAAGEGHNCRK